jgi:hypothetical protein
MSPPQITIQYENPFSLLVINSQGKIRKIATPFKVKCIKPVGSFLVGEIVTIEKLAFTKQIPILYRIDNRWYNYKWFNITVDF